MEFFNKNARRLKIVLSIVLFLQVVLAVAFIFFSIKYLRDYAGTVKQAVYDSSTSEAKVDNTKKLSSILKQKSSSVDLVKKLVADSKSYQYQDVIINDLSSMASRAGVSVTNYDFSGKATPAATPSASASSGTAPATGGATTPVPASSGLKSTTVSVTLDSPTNFQNFLKFIHYIEQNNTKMQISTISLASTQNNQNRDLITSGILTIEVYIR